MCIFDIQDLGGIINHAEHLIYGLKHMRHEVTLVRIEDKTKVVDSSCSRDLQHNTFSGIPLDQRAGWKFPLENRIPIRSTNWKKYTSKYDLVLWEVPVPPKQDMSLFKKLYNIPVAQIVFVHDGNAVKMYPHIKRIADKVEYFACVHPCALGNMTALGIDNIELILNPQALWKGRMNKPNWEERVKRVCSFQTFKAWKRVEDLVKAVPYINADYIVLGGGGIEYYYMTSKTKCKSKYRGIWDKALESGMWYVGYTSEQKRDVIMQDSRLLIDTSWSKGYAKYGSHFNRVMVDGIIQGCIPVVRDLAMEGVTPFKWLKHYLEIPYDASAKKFAGLIDCDLRLDSNTANKMIRSAQAVVRKEFDAIKIARKLLDSVIKR